MGYIKNEKNLCLIKIVKKKNMMRVKPTMIKMVIFLVICATILDESTSYTPPGPECYKDLSQDCSNRVHDAICQIDKRPVVESVGGCTVTLFAYVSGDCFFNRLAKDVQKTCSVNPETALYVTIDIWNLVNGATS